MTKLYARRNAAAVTCGYPTCRTRLARLSVDGEVFFSRDWRYNELHKRYELKRSTAAARKAGISGVKRMRNASYLDENGGVHIYATDDELHVPTLPTRASCPSCKRVSYIVAAGSRNC